MAEIVKQLGYARFVRDQPVSFVPSMGAMVECPDAILLHVRPALEGADYLLVGTRGAHELGLGRPLVDLTTVLASNERGEVLSNSHDGLFHRFFPGWRDANRAMFELGYEIVRGDTSW